MDSDSTKIFNDRLAQWVAKQGFWFQLRYSMAGGGSTMLMYHMMRLLLKVFVFFVILAAIAIAYLVKRTDQQAFDSKLKEALVEGFHAQSGRLRSFDRTQNKASIRYLLLQGGPKSFFDRCEMTGITFRMGLLDGIIGTWDANQISVDRMSLNVKAGAETEEEAANLGRALAKRFDSVNFQAFECKNTRISWGYSARTMGHIEQSRLTAVRDHHGWRLTFEGGKFSQNWLKDLRIDELVVLLNDKQLIIEKGEFSYPHDQSAGVEPIKKGKVFFKNVIAEGGLRPQLSGSITIENIPLAPLLQDSHDAYIEGIISGELNLAGSTNAPEGIELTGRILLNEGDRIDLRNRLPLLNSLSILSPSGSYRKVHLTQGSFAIRTGGGRMQLDDLQLLAVGQMEIKGSISARPASNKEIEEMLNKGSIDIIISEDDTSLRPSERKDEVSLSQVAEMLGDEQSGMGFEGKLLDTSLPFQAELNEKEMQLKLAERLAVTAIYDGRLSIALPVQAFPQDDWTQKKLPRAVDSDVIFLDCPLRGNLNEITLAQAEALLSVDGGTALPDSQSDLHLEKSESTPAKQQ